MRKNLAFLKRKICSSEQWTEQIRKLSEECKTLEIGPTTAPQQIVRVTKQQIVALAREAALFLSGERITLAYHTSIKLIEECVCSFYNSKMTEQKEFDPAVSKVVLEDNWTSYILATIDPTCSDIIEIVKYTLRQLNRSTDQNTNDKKIPFSVFVESLTNAINKHPLFNFICKPPSPPTSQHCDKTRGQTSGFTLTKPIVGLSRAQQHMFDCCPYNHLTFLGGPKQSSESSEPKTVPGSDSHDIDSDGFQVVRSKKSNRNKKAPQTISSSERVQWLCLPNVLFFNVFRLLCFPLWKDQILEIPDALQKKVMDVRKVVCPSAKDHCGQHNVIQPHCVSCFARQYYESNLLDSEETTPVNVVQIPQICKSTGEIVEQKEITTEQNLHAGSRKEVPRAEPIASIVPTQQEIVVCSVIVRYDEENKVYSASLAGTNAGASCFGLNTVVCQSMSIANLVDDLPQAIRPILPLALRTRELELRILVAVQSLVIRNQLV